VQAIEIGTTASVKAGALDLQVRGVVCDAVSHRYCQPIRMRFELAAVSVDASGGDRASYALEVTLPPE